MFKITETTPVHNEVSFYLRDGAFHKLFDGLKKAIFLGKLDSKKRYMITIKEM